MTSLPTSSSTATATSERQQPNDMPISNQSARTLTTRTSSLASLSASPFSNVRHAKTICKANQRWQQSRLVHTLQAVAVPCFPLYWPLTHVRCLPSLSFSSLLLPFYQLSFPCLINSYWIWYSWSAVPYVSCSLLQLHIRNKKLKKEQRVCCQVRPHDVTVNKTKRDKHRAALRNMASAAAQHTQHWERARTRERAESAQQKRRH